MPAENPHAAVEAVIRDVLRSTVQGSVEGAICRALAAAVASGRLSASQVGAAFGVRAVLEHRVLGEDETWTRVPDIAVVGTDGFRVRFARSPGGR